MKILYLASWYPYPPDNGSRLRTFHLLKCLSAEHRISLIGLTDPDQTPVQLDPLRPFCATIQPYPRRVYQPRRAAALAAIFSERPRSIVDTFDPDLWALIQRTVTENKCDVILASQLSMAAYAARLDYPVQVFDEAEAGLYAGAYENATGASRIRYGLTWWKYRRYLRRLAAHFSAVTVVSEQERRKLIGMNIPSGHIHVVPNGVDCKGTHPQQEYEPYSLIYPGALTFSANLDAMRYFVREILPLVQKQEPRVRLTITGHAPQVAINELSLDNSVSFVGYVTDVQALVRSSALCIVPLRVGGGTRLKILEAMALGTPVVATGKGAEGLNLIPDEHLLIADTAVSFANAILRVLHTPALRVQLARAARIRVCAEYDWQAIAQRLSMVLTDLATAH